MTIFKCAAASLVALVGFSTASFAQPTAQPPDATDECPLFVQGSKLVVKDLPDGVKITITTSKPDSVAPLRTATRGVVDLIEQHESKSDVTPVMSEPGQPQFPPMAIDVQDTAHGVVVTIHAKNKTDVSDVRDSAHTLDQMWHTSRCINPEMTSRT